MTVTVNTGRALFAFSCEQEWCERAKFAYARCGVSTYDTVAIDAAGRVCTRGKHFIRAEREGTYPVTVYAVDDDPDPRANTPAGIEAPHATTGGR